MEYSYDIEKPNIENAAVTKISGLHFCKNQCYLINLTSYMNPQVYITSNNCFIWIITMLLFHIIITNTANAQNNNFEWAISFGGNQNDYNQAMAKDENDNLFLTGRFSDTVDFNPGLDTFLLFSSANDGYILKLNSNGSFIWAKQLISTSSCIGTSITTDVYGNILVTGNFKNVVDFDPGAGVFNLTANSLEDIFILKLDSLGNFIWAKQIGSTQKDEAGDITTDIFGNIFIVGAFKSTIDTDPGPAINNLTSLGSTDVLILKLDSAGNQIWAKQLGGSSIERGVGITVDSLGSVYTVGTFQGIVDFDPGVLVRNYISNGSNDAFIHKLDSIGNFVWAKQIGGSNVDHINDIAIDKYGYIYTTGYFEGMADFDPGLDTLYLNSNIGSKDYFILKLNSFGDFDWVRHFGGTNLDAGIAIAIDSDQNVYTIGNFQDDVDFNPLGGGHYLESAGSSDVFVHKLSSTGQFHWVIQIGGSNIDNGVSVHVDNDNNVYSSGSYRSTVDFDPSLNQAVLISNGYGDMFTQKLTCSTFSTDTQIACNSIVWIDGNTYHSTNNSATFSMPNSNGCDSTIRLDLTIPNIDTVITATGMTITANQSGAIYQWLDCDNFMYPIIGENSQSFTATTPGNYAVEITQLGCSDTSQCYSVVNSSIFNLSNNPPYYTYQKNNELIIELDKLHSNISAKIITIEGKIIQTKLIENSKRISLSNNHPPGYYILELCTQEGNRFVLRFINF